MNFIAVNVPAAKHSIKFVYKFRNKIDFSTGKKIVAVFVVVLLDVRALHGMHTKAVLVG